MDYGPNRLRSEYLEYYNLVKGGDENPKTYGQWLQGFLRKKKKRGRKVTSETARTKSVSRGLSDAGVTEDEIRLLRD